MNNKPAALTQADILGILQDAHSVPLGQPMFNSSEDYNKLKAIIESAIRYTHPKKTQADIEYEADKAYWRTRELTDEEIEELREYHGINDWLYETSVTDFARAILKKASEK